MHTSFQNTNAAQTPIRIIGIPVIRINITLENVTIANVNRSAGINPIQILIPDNYGLVLKNITFNNVKTNIILLRLEGAVEKYIENLNVINCTLLDTQAVAIQGSGKVTLKNLTFEQITVSDAFSGDILQLVRYYFQTCTTFLTLHK